MPVEHLGTVLFVARKVRDLSLREVSQGAGVPLTRLAQYERGISMPGPVDFCALCRTLKRPAEAPRRWWPDEAHDHRLHTHHAEHGPGTRGHAGPGRDGTPR